MYGVVLPLLKDTFEQVENLVPPPQVVHRGHQKAYRFVEQSPQQVILVKLARVVSGVQAAWILLNAGFTQEFAALQRVLDELSSDILFLIAPLVGMAREPAHDQYLKDFFQEEFEAGKSAVESEQKRTRVPRRKIRAYIARTFSPDEPTDQVVAVSETIESAYSGFIHGGYSHTMDTYSPRHRGFRVDGMIGSQFLDDSFDDFRNTLHRALLDAAVASKSVGLDSICQQLTDRSNELAREYGLWPDSKL